MRYLYIAVGGGVGALARWGLSTWVTGSASAPTALPLGVLIVNLSGCLVLGFLYPYMLAIDVAPELRLGVATGFLGAYTTFATWESGLFTLLARGAAATALLYAALTLAGGLTCTMAGRALARRLGGAPGPGPAG